MTTMSEQSRAQLEHAYRTLLRERGLAAEFHDFPHIFTGPAPSNEPAHAEEFWREFLNWPYTGFSEVAKEPRNVLIARLASVKGQARPFAGSALPDRQHMLDIQSGKVENLIEQSGQSVPSVYCGIYPTGLLNASAQRSEAGTLILVNSGLQQLLYRFAKIQVSSARFGKDPPRIDSIQAAVASVDLFNAYVFGANPELAKALPVLEGPRRVVAENLAQTCEVFVLAHEYGHVLGGHFDSNESILSVKTPGGPRVAVLTTAEDQEFEADRIAVSLLGRALGAGQNIEPRLQAVSFAGISMFFLIEATAEFVAINSGVEINAATGHPGTEQRLQRILSLLAPLAVDAISFDFHYAMMHQLLRHKDTMLAVLEEVGQYRPVT
jgi:hypothetical protein